MSEGWVQWLLGVGLTVVGWVSHMLWQDVKGVKDSHKETAIRLQNIEVLIAGEYLKRTEFREFQNTILEKLDKILDALNTKEDKK
jgi:hypothetical protein